MGSFVMNAVLGIVLEGGAGWLGNRISPLPFAPEMLVLALIVGIGAILIGRIALKNRDCETETLAKWEKRVWLVWTAEMANAMLIGFLLGATGWFEKTVTMAVCACVGLIWLEPLLSFALCWPSTTQPHSRKNELTGEGFPEIIRAVRECAKKAVIRGASEFLLPNAALARLKNSDMTAS